MKSQFLFVFCFFLLLGCQPKTLDTLEWECQKRSYPDAQVLANETMEKEEERLIAADVLQGSNSAAYRALAVKLAAEDAVSLLELGKAFDCKTCLWECRFQDEAEKAPLAMKIRNIMDSILQEVSLVAVADQFLSEFTDQEWENPVVKFTFLGLVHNLTQPSQEKGIHIKRPAWQEGLEAESKLKDRNILPILVNAKGEILVKGKELSVEELQLNVKAFISNPNQLPDLADSPRQAIVALSNERGTPYDQYLKVYKTIRTAYHELWNEYAIENYGKPYDDALPDSIKSIIQQAIPFMVSEAEPTDFE
ncbi:MAG: biopolymer transporter ExbD [Saprospiraceae bacterium]|nr:biopolymer transporter ExbD [Saprospiraceae bacterium]